MPILTRCFVGMGLLVFGCQGFASNPPTPSTSIVNHANCRKLMFAHQPSTGSAAHMLRPRSRATGSASRGASSTIMSLARTATTGAATTAVLLRGGGLEHNVISGVLAELANIRTPAALLGGAALGTMFVQLKPGGNRRLHLLYHMLSTSAFSLQLVCVLCSTLTYTSVASRPEALAVSAISYLSNQMQWEFFVIRGSFVYGLFSFLGALAVRGWLAYPEDGERGSARVIMAILVSSAVFLLNFIHHTHNSLTLCLGGMTKTLVQLTLRNMYPTKRRFFRHVFWAIGIWGAVKVLKLGPNERPGQETHGNPTKPSNTDPPPN